MKSLFKITWWESVAYMALVVGMAFSTLLDGVWFAICLATLSVAGFLLNRKVFARFGKAR